MDLKAIWRSSSGFGEGKIERNPPLEQLDKQATMMSRKFIRTTNDSTH